jgi:uncharacterized protein
VALPPPAPASTALISGASAGIGREFARALAARGHGVTLVARRAERLERLAAELADAHGVRAEAIPADLADGDARERLIAEVERRGLTVEVLVNNAGFGIYTTFAASDPAREQQQLDVLVGAVVHLNAAYLPGMVERGRGTVINVSSTSGFQPLPGSNTYAAAKAYVLFHSEALSGELKGTGVTATAVCPGPVRTEFQEASQPLFTERLPKPVWTTPERVAADGLRAAERGKRAVVPGGARVRAFFALNRIMPVGISLPIAARLMSQELERGRRAHG